MQSGGRGIAGWPDGHERRATPRRGTLRAHATQSTHTTTTTIVVAAAVAAAAAAAAAAAGGAGGRGPARQRGRDT